MLLKVENLSKSFETIEGDIEVLSGVNLTVEIGDRVALTGESGSGKSTLLHLVGAMDSFQSGEIYIQDQALSTLSDKGRSDIRRNLIGIIFQQFNLIPSLSVKSNLEFFARLCGRFDKGWSDLLVDRLGLSSHLEHYPEQLSGGQQQRVAIGRVLAARPKLILADEPTGNLDENTSAGVADLMFQLTRETGAALLMVTHSKQMAARADRQLHLELGRIVSDVGKG